MMQSIPLESILKEYTIPEMAVGDEKEISQEEWDQAMKMMKDHNNAIDPEIKGFYYIDVTGRWEVYFTLWRWKDIDPRIAMFIKNPIYMGNMTTNFITSVKKALDKIPKKVRFQIMTEQNREGLIGKNSSRSNETLKFTFGKYRGQSLGEVYLEDPRYITWLAQNQDPKYSGTKINVAISMFAKMYYEEVTKQNQEKFKDVQFYGKIGDKFEGEVEVYKISEKQGQSFSYYDRNKVKTYTDIRAVDNEGNKFIIYNLDKAFPNHNIEKGTKVKIRGTVKDQREILGIKFTRLSYVKGIDAGNATPKPKEPTATVEPTTPATAAVPTEPTSQPINEGFKRLDLKSPAFVEGMKIAIMDKASGKRQRLSGMDSDVMRGYEAVMNYRDTGGDNWWDRANDKLTKWVSNVGTTFFSNK
jgi:hypothetical protein